MFFVRCIAAFFILTLGIQFNTRKPLRMLSISNQIKNGCTILIALFFFQIAIGQTTSSHLRISILTAAPGEELYSTFGHTAIRIIDSSKQMDLVYNYGTFDFSDPDFYTKFTRGKLDYFLSVGPFPEFLYEFQMEKRDVIEQVLELPASANTAIQQALAENLSGRNRYYKYDFLYDNCTTRVKDILQKFAGLQVTSPLVANHTSFRNMLHEYLDKGGQAWSKVGIDLLLGSPIDKEVDINRSMFLPDYLMKGIDSAASKERSTFPIMRSLINTGIALDPGNRFIPLIIFSAIAIVFFLVGFLKNKFFVLLTKFTDTLLFFLTGAIGCLLLFMWFGTDHKSCSNNYNLLWALPTHLLAVVGVWKSSSWMNKYLLVAAIIHLITLITWFWLPQQLNIAFIPITILLMVRSYQLSKRS